MLPDPSDKRFCDCRIRVRDIVLAELQPVVGSDIGNARLALMLTTKEFNCMGDVLIVPIKLGGDYSRHRG